METYIEAKSLVENPNFHVQRKNSLAILKDEIIDAPIIDLIHKINGLPYCFTIQSCFGHFLYNHQKIVNNLDLVPLAKNTTTVHYRIAYVAFCIDNSDAGYSLLRAFSKIPLIDRENIQFCCAEWFWERQLNSYVLQVEPERYKDKDQIAMDYEEAVKIEKTRNVFFDRLRVMMADFI